VPVNLAETAFAASIVSVHVLEAPAHAPPQPSNVASEAGAAVRVTLDPVATLVLHVVPPFPQSIPLPVTLPLPVTETVSGTVAPPPPENAAVTLRSSVIEIVQVGDVPAHAPPQPLKLAPDPGVAVSVTCDPAGSLALQPEPPAEVQAIPPPVTVPLPVTETVSAWAVED
jgi:hypothetical protein